MRQRLLGFAWLLAVILIALGAAGLLAGLDTPTDAGSRPWLTARDDAVVSARLDAITTDLAAVSDQLDALGVQGRGALAALVANDPAIAAQALDTGDEIIADIGTRSGRIEAALADLPLIGKPEGEYRLGPAVRERHARLARALASTRGLEAQWALVASGSAPAARLSNLLATHDDAVLAAAAHGRQTRYAEALTALDAADAAITDARGLRDRLARTMDVETLDQWLDRSARYDVALRGLYTTLRDSDGQVNAAVREALTKERQAKDQLPPDTRGLVLIMAQIGRGGMNGAVIAIEEARGQLTDALAEPSASPGG